jgi:putative FmdB family regulatory protein
MPIYEYVCEGCGARFERYLRSWAEPVACPECQSPQVEKQLSRLALAGAATPEGAPAAGGCCGGGCGCAH